MSGMASRHRSNSIIPHLWKRRLCPLRMMAARSGRPAGESTLQPRPKVRPRTRERPSPAPGYRCGRRGGLPFAVIGFAAVGVFAALLMFSYAQFVVANDAVVTLRNDLKTLQAENVTLSAQYEQVFDMERIQAAVGTRWSAPPRSRLSIWTCLSRTAWCCTGRRSPPPACRGAPRA